MITANPAKIMEIGLGFWRSKVLLTAVKLKLFTLLGGKELSWKEIQSHLSLDERGLYDFLDSLVALGFLKRKGIRESSFYKNSDEAEMFLVQTNPDYVGGILEMSNNRLYPFWNNLETALKTGMPQSEIKDGGTSLFQTLAGNRSKLREFVNAMDGKKGEYVNFHKKFDFSRYNTLCDIGGAGGHLAATLALQNLHMRCITFDLKEVSEIAKENIKKLGVENKVTVVAGDFFTDDFPKADVITMSNVLHNWGIKDKKLLIRKAYEALPYDGALVVMECIVDDNRNINVEALMMSLNMLIETESGFDFSFKDFKSWATEAGFKAFSSFQLSGHTTAIIATK